MNLTNIELSYKVKKGSHSEPNLRYSRLEKRKSSYQHLTVGASAIDTGMPNY
jgi:hypothetical protein